MCEQSRHEKRRSRRRESTKTKGWLAAAQCVTVFAVAICAIHELKYVVSQNKDTRQLRAQARSGADIRKYVGAETNETPGRGRDETADWLEQSAASAREFLRSTAQSASSAWDDASNFGSNVIMTGGLVLLPSLSLPAQATNQNGSVPAEKINSASAASSDLAKGSSWSIASAMGDTEALPAYLKAVAVNSAPKLKESAAVAEGEGRESVFAARRKGTWMGCTPPYYMICKGVYRAIKKLNAVTVLDTSCKENTVWLPFVIMHLKKEFRLVRLICTDRSVSKLSRVHLAYQGFKHVSFSQFDPFEDVLTNKTDVVIAVNLLRQETLIRSMKFFKLLKENKLAGGVVYENYPESANKPIASKTLAKEVVLLNTFTVPFLFGPPEYRYESTEEQPGSRRMEIAFVSPARIFEHKSTPSFADLMHPDLRDTKV
jgi:hypothetical protein